MRNVGLICAVCFWGALGGCGDSDPSGNENQNNRNVSARCGDGVVESPEECDDGAANSDTVADACRSDCVAAHCGDRVKDASELCDGDDLGGVTCQSLGYPGGQLACQGDCTLDLTTCTGGCGNGLIEAGEECEGPNLAGESCLSLGFSAGELVCRTDCLFDRSVCVGGCGNGMREGSEVCDGDDLGGGTCVGLGFSSGTLRCGSDCLFDRSACVGGCGNDVLEGEEDCDGDDLGAETCSSLGFDSGVLACGAGCDFDLTGCAGGCGNGVVDAGEECDCSDLDGESCTAHGWTGSLLCTGGCTYDWASCVGCGNGVVDGTDECDDGNVEDWDGCSQCGIAEIRFGENQSMFPVVATRGATGFVVAWTHNDGTSNYEVKAQTFETLGTTIIPEFQVNTYTSGDQWLPSIAAAPDGRFVMVYQSENTDCCTENSVWGQRFDANGAPGGSEFQVSTSTDTAATSPAVAMGGDGRFVVVWTRWGAANDVYARRYHPDGTPDGGAFLVNVTTQGTQAGASVAMAPDGRFVVAWGSTFGEPRVARLYTAGGVAVDGEIPVFATVPTYSGGVEVAMDALGRFVVIGMLWDLDGYEGGIFGRRFDAVGDPLGAEFQVNTTWNDNQCYPSVSMAADGRFVVVWETKAQYGGGDDGIFGQRYSADGSTLGGEFQVNVRPWSMSASTFPHSSVAMDDSGRFVVVWDEHELYFQRFDAAGEPRGILPW